MPHGRTRSGGGSGALPPGPYHRRGTSSAFIGIIEFSDEKAAIEKAVEEHGIPENQRNRLMAQRRDRH
jgi:hypothetical protein